MDFNGEWKLESKKFRIKGYDVIIGEKNFCSCRGFKFRKDETKNCKHILEAFKNMAYADELRNTQKIINDAIAELEINHPEIIEIKFINKKLLVTTSG
jgi:predicted nucleic acid-binding Zn finger protein